MKLDRFVKVWDMIMLNFFGILIFGCSDLICLVIIDRFISFSFVCICVWKVDFFCMILFSVIC